MKYKSTSLTKILVIVIVLLVIVMVYAFAIRPAVSGFVVDKQVDAYNQGYTQAWVDLTTQIRQTADAQGWGTAQFTIGENQVSIVGQAQVSPVNQAQ